MTGHATARLEIKSWDEQPYQELPDGRKFTRASVTVTAGPEPEAGQEALRAEGTFDSLMYYAADGTARYVSLMYLTGRVADRSGSFVLAGEGDFDGTRARGEFAVVPGSGTGDLAGITGTAVSVSTHADYPHMPLVLDYDLQ